MSKLVACGEFVKRQTKDSGYSYFDGSWELLEQMAERSLKFDRECIMPGYRNGVIIVNVLPFNFYSAIVNLTEATKINASYSPRREGEGSYIRVCASMEKQEAKYASLVLYRKDVLDENDERQTGAEWEIVAIKASVDQEEEPMNPMTMARNFLHLKGGTQGTFTAEQFAKSIVYWNSHCMAASKQPWYNRLMFWRK
jgi:hypothetical protein